MFVVTVSEPSSPITQGYSSTHYVRCVLCFDYASRHLMFWVFWDVVKLELDVDMDDRRGKGGLCTASLTKICCAF